MRLLAWTVLFANLSEALSARQTIIDPAEPTPDGGRSFVFQEELELRQLLDNWFKQRDRNLELNLEALTDEVSLRS